MRPTTLHLTAGSLVLSLAALVGCGSDTDGTTASTPSSRSYSGTASVGDFLTVSLDPTARTMRYRNVTNGDDYTVAYTIGSDGGYTFTDSTGNLTTGYEVPGYAMVIAANHAGPLKDTPAVITAIKTTTVTTDVFRSKSYNYMQFRTNSGGLEIGHIQCGSDGTIHQQGYWPFGATHSSSDTFNSGDLPTTDLVANADRSALTLTTVDHGATQTDYIFATPAGFLAVDTPNGAIVCIQERASGAFDAPTMAGSYKAILYQKTGAETGMNNTETSASQSVLKGTITISSIGHVAVTDENGGTIVADAVLTPLADRADLMGSGKLTSDCPGSFSFTILDGGDGESQDVFVSFLDDAILVSSFKNHDTAHNYDYFYGVALRGAPTGIGALPRLAGSLAAATVR